MKSAASPSLTSNRLRVVFIVGYGRSGSTFLDIALANHPEIEGLGELINLPRAAWMENEFCACGKRAGQCDFWRMVHTALEARIGSFDPVAYSELQHRFERTSSLLRLMVERVRPSAEFLRYRDQAVALFRAIADVSGRRVLVDSSKSPERAFALSTDPRLDARVLHLVRDVRGVIWSLKKGYRRDEAAGLQREIRPAPAWRSALAWRWANLRTAALARSLPAEARRFIRYEDLASDPDITFDAIGRWLGMDMGGLGQRVMRGDAMTIGHTVAGNRLRMRGEIRLQPDLEWVDNLSASDQAIAWRLAKHQIIRYGYRRNGPVTRGHLRQTS